MLSSNFKPKGTAAASRAVSLRQHGFLVLIHSRIASVGICKMLPNVDDCSHAAPTLNKGQSHGDRRHRCERVIWAKEKLYGIDDSKRWLARALLSSYRLSTVTIPLPVTVWQKSAKQILTGGSDPNPIPKSPVSVERPRPPSNTMLLGTTRVSLPNGTSFRPTALAECTSVTDIGRCPEILHHT